MIAKYRARSGRLLLLTVCLLLAGLRIDDRVRTGPDPVPRGRKQDR